MTQTPVTAVLSHTRNMGEKMRWYLYFAYFFGGAFLANAIPHIVNGMSGRSFPTLLLGSAFLLHAVKTDS